MSVTLTEAAAKHVQKYLARRGKGVGLRLGVKTSGCSGMVYSHGSSFVMAELR